jgi:L-malate glycosyltransferase
VKQRILQLVDSFDEGGSERQALQLTRLLHESGKYEVFLASLKADGVLRSEVEKLGLGDIPTFPLQSFYDRNAVEQLRKFVRYLRTSKIDLLHTHDFYTNIFGMTAGLLAGVRIRIASRRETSGMRSNAQQKAQRFAYALAHHVVANSESVRNKLLLEGINSQRITVIHNGLEIDRLAVPEGTSRAAALAKLEVGEAAKTCERFVTIVANMRHDVKDYPMFLRAAQRISAAIPKTGFLLAGEGQLRESLERMAVELKIDHNTFFLGRCANLAELLKASDVCVLSSKAEGFSNSILEYMAAGRPVVATDVGGAREAIIEGETGYTVPSGDDELMAERIVSLLQDPEKARLMGEKGRRVVEERFSSRALLQNTEALYEKLLTGPDSTVNADRKNVRTPQVDSRILVVAPSFDILGGQSVQAARLISRLRNLPFLEVGFLAINPRLPGVLRKLQSIKYLRTVVTSFLYIVTLLARVPKFDVIHIFSASYFSFVLAPTPAILIGKLFGKRILLNYHSGEAEDHLTRWPSAVATIRLADVVAVPSEYLAGVFAKFGLTAQAINNIIEVDRFAFRERKPLRPIFLCNRNLETHYGVDCVLRAFALIQKRFPDAQLNLVGDGTQRAALEELARDLKLRNTRFFGRVEHQQIIEQYQAADIYLNGSEIDNQPLSILEAFACGLPVVTTNAGGIPHLAADSETALLVNVGDYQALAKRALRLLEEPDLADSLVRRAREECKKYSWPAVSDKWLDLYSNPGNGDRGRPEAQTSSRIRKLWNMSFDEIRVRSLQSFAVFAERHGWSRLTKLPSDEELIALLSSPVKDGSESSSTCSVLEHVRRLDNANFFSAFDDREAAINEFRHRWPAAEKEIVAAAERIADGRFDLLGLKDISFGDPINWHFEPLSGKTSPMLHWSRVDYLDPDIAGDKKIIWELNRHQYFVTLGQAYWFTNDEKFAATFAGHIESWMNANPPKLGINWASSLEIALRSISWLWALYFFKDSPSVSPDTFTRALKFLYLNARHLETYLSTYFSPNTHLTGEALGLFYLGTLLPEFRESARWRETGRNILVEQLSRHVRPDGVYFEQSSYYHRYTTDFYTHLLILSRIKGEQLEPAVEQKLQALLDHLMYITLPDGTSPLFGDDDGGRLTTLDRRPANDFRAALSTGAALFKRGDYKFVAGDLAEETFWLLGPQGAAEFDQVRTETPATQSMAFPDGGYYVMRDGWHDSASYLLFDCGPHGANNCGHAHADALAIEVAANGRPLLVDPGTHTYTGSQELRDWFRGSLAHNVLTVDGESSSISTGPFSWKTIAQCEPLSWISERRFDYVSGRHDGYERLAEPATHTRSILFLKNDYWLLRDRLVGEGKHQAQLRFHLPADSNIQFNSESGGQHLTVETGQNAGLQAFAFGPEGVWSREDGWISHCYGERVAAPVCVFSAKIDETEELVTLLLPTTHQASSRFTVNEVEAIGGRAFEIESADHRDLVLLRHPSASRVETVRMVSDFELTWTRFSRRGTEANDELLELLVLDGKRLELDGNQILKSGKHVSYLMASQRGNKFQLETSEGLLDLNFPIEDLELLFARAKRQSEA